MFLALPTIRERCLNLIDGVMWSFQTLTCSFLSQEFGSRAHTFMEFIIDSGDWCQAQHE